MSKPENQFISSIHTYLPHTLHKEKMHNMYRAGTADCWYSGTLADLWIEYKFEPSLPVQDRFIFPKLSPLQERWCNSRYAEGRNVHVIVGYPRGGVLYYNPDEWSKTGIDTDVLLNRLMVRKELANYIYNFTTGSFIDVI